MTITVKAELVRLVFKKAVFFWDLYNCMRWSCLSPSRCGFNAFLPCYQVMLQLSVVWLLVFCLFCLQSTINCILFSTMTPWCRRHVSICSVSKFVFVASTAVLLFVDIDAW